MPFWTNICISWPHICITHFQVCQICYQANLVYSTFFWTTLYLNSLETILLIHLKKNQRLIFLMWPSNPFYFIVNYLIVVYFTFIYFLSKLQLCQLPSLTQFWCYIKLLKWCTTFNYLLSIKVITNYLYLRYIMKQCRGIGYRSPLYIKL